MAHHISTLTQLITSSSYEKKAWKLLNAQDKCMSAHVQHGEINLWIAICLKNCVALNDKKTEF